MSKRVSTGRLAGSHDDGDWLPTLIAWLDLRAGAPTPQRRDIIDRLSIEVAMIDRLLAAQIDATLHHPTFQALESSWRGLRRLTDRVPHDRDDVQIRLLDVSWRELTRDIDRAIEFDQSNLFRKVYTAEFGTPGGKPFGVLVGDYQVRHHRSPDHPDDVGTLRGIAEVAAAAFAPFIAAAHPSLFGLDGYRDLDRPIDLAATFRAPEYTAWNSLRRIEDSRFIGLTVPRILLRRPYRHEPRRADGFVYREQVSAADGSELLWGSAGWAFAEVLIRTFADNGWLADIRGADQDGDARGLLTDLETGWFDAPGSRLIPKGTVELQLTADQEREFGESGFIALTHCHDTPFAAFYGNQSIHAPPQTSTSRREPTVADINAKLSSMLQYVFCVSRFAHYVKVIARDKVGSFTRPEEVETLLRAWLIEYATTKEDASPELQARYPLREASVQVRETPGRPGVFQTVIHLRPHYQLDQMTSSVKLVTELFAGRDI